jgi:hypothetical protein
LFDSKCDNCVKNNVCELKRKLSNLKYEKDSEFRNTIYDVIKTTNFTNSDFGFNAKFEFGTRECKYYLASKEDYLDEKAKKERDLIATKEKMAMALLESLEIERSNRPKGLKDLGISMYIDDYNGTEEENRLQTFYAVCDRLYETFGSAEAIYGVYGNEIPDVQFTFSLNNFKIVVTYCPRKNMDYNETMKQIKRYADVATKKT